MTDFHTPTPMIFEIRMTATYYDDDPRMSGTSSSEESLYVVATNYKEAHALAAPKMEAFHKRYPDTCKFETGIVVLEELVVAKPPPRALIGFHTQRLLEIKILAPKGYQLVVRLEKT